MKITKPSATYGNRTVCSRALASALLVGIIYSVTFGSAHSHGNVSLKLETYGASELADQASVSKNVTNHRHSGENECLICLLHQQQSNSIVHSPVFAVLPSTEVAFVRRVKIPFSSGSVVFTPISRPSGRAPPRY